MDAESVLPSDCAKRRKRWSGGREEAQEMVRGARRGARGDQEGAKRRKGFTLRRSSSCEAINGGKAVSQHQSKGREGWQT